MQNSLDKTIIEISTKLNSLGIDWFLGSSAALLVHGIEITPKDVDVLYTKIKDEKVICKEFNIAESVDFPLELAIVINETKIEFIYYSEPAEISRVAFGGVYVPVDSLKNLLRYYKRILGKEWIVKLIEEKTNII